MALVDKETPETIFEHPWNGNPVASGRWDGAAGAMFLTFFHLLLLSLLNVFFIFTTQGVSCFIDSTKASFFYQLYSIRLNQNISKA